MQDYDMRDLPPELQEPWQAPPDFDTKTEWVFLHADVIHHSRLFQDHMGGAALKTNHNALKGFRELVRKAIPHFEEDMEWDWAGDGGIFAFHDSSLRAARKVILVAERIRNTLREQNSHQPNPALQLEARIVLTRGWAYYYPEKELRCGSALNIAAKLRIPGERTSIAVTESVANELQDEAMKMQLRPIDPLESIGEPVYVYVPALRDALQESLDQEAQNGDRMQAAHLAYRLGTLNYGIGERQDAISAFHRAEVLLAQVESPHRYYHRTLTAFYRLWRELAEATSDALLAAGDGNDRRQFLRELPTRDHSLKEKFGNRWQFLHEMEFCIEQLDILARHPVADPSGLTSMQMCLLLERFGYPRRWHGSAISGRIERIKDELRSTETDTNLGYERGTMDKGCSLCTAVAASCLILDNRDDAYASQMVRWLISKKQQRFSFRSSCQGSRVPDHQHALHYAASVLQVLVDCNDGPEAIRDVVDVFFARPVNADKLPDHWVQYLHIPYFDLACYIFSAFARTLIAHDQPTTIGLTDVRRAMLRNALQAFASRLLAEAELAHCAPERIYAARENLGSFALAMFIGFPDDADSRLMFEGIRNLIAEVASKDKLDVPDKRKITIDSNFDRMWRMLDGWLLQWECALVARERGLDILQEFAHLFPSV